MRDLLTTQTPLPPRSRLAHGLQAVERLVGNSEWVRRMRDDILRVAPHPANVLITGPTGTGKELIAQAIHAHSSRGPRPFVTVDCAAVGGTLFASQMFGHVKGAFTGASDDTLGFVRAADGGTLFLDEVGELEMEFQAKLLRVVQEQAVTPLGSHQSIRVDIRIIAATNRELAAQVASGRFREDLYYRLNVIPLQTLPLKQRPEDIEAIARHYWSSLARPNGRPVGALPPRCLDCLRSHDWPGNVRELVNFLERLAVLGHVNGRGAECGEHSVVCIATRESGTTNLPQSSPPVLPAESPLPGLADRAEGERSSEWPTLEALEREHIQKTLQRVGYNQAAAAKLLNIHRHQLARKIKRHGLETPSRQPRRRSTPPDA